MKTFTTLVVHLGLLFPLAMLVSRSASAASFDCGVKRLINDPAIMSAAKVKRCGKFQFDSSKQEPKDQIFNDCPAIVVAYTPHAIRHGSVALTIASRSNKVSVNPFGGAGLAAKTFPEEFVLEYSLPRPRKGKTPELEAYEMECRSSTKVDSDSR